MSNKNKKRGPRGPYTLKVRARRWEQAHERITLAALKLHETVGPAKTTMEEIAHLAGVQRATVYNHFPTELDLLDACSAHWFVENPPPDSSAWKSIEDPEKRSERALLEMYNYFGEGSQLLSRVLSDAPVVPAMDQIRRQKWQPMLEEIVSILTVGWPGNTAESAVTASLRVALDFFTWQSLSESGLSNEAAAKLAAAWIIAASHS